MSNKENKLPFCPKCGKKEFVSSVSDYYRAWECKLCKISFTFEKVDHGISILKPVSPKYILRRSIQPARLGSARRPLQPARVAAIERIALLEQNKDRVTLTTDRNLLKDLLKSDEMQSRLSDSLDQLKKVDFLDLGK